MEAQDNIRMKGTFLAQLKDADGNVVEERKVENLITTTGKQLMTFLLGALDTSVKPDFMAVGTGAGAPAAGDTDLGTEVFREAINSFTAVTTTTTDDTIQYVMEIGPGELTSGALTEAGLFGSSVTEGVASGAVDSGHLLSRVTYPAINKTSSLTLTITWKIQQL